MCPCHWVLANEIKCWVRFAGNLIKRNWLHWEVHPFCPSLHSSSCFQLHRGELENQGPPWDHEMPSRLKPSSRIAKEKGKSLRPWCLWSHHSSPGCLPPDFSYLREKEASTLFKPLLILTDYVLKCWTRMPIITVYALIVKILKWNICKNKDEKVLELNDKLDLIMWREMFAEWWMVRVSLDEKAVCQARE